MWTDNLKHFHFWCQKVLPLVYDDSLSYYEVLCKITEHLNRLTTLVNEIGDELERYEDVTDRRLDALESWKLQVDQWRDNIDIWQGQINSWKDGIDSWKLEIDEWKNTVSTWITNTVDPFILDMTNRVGTIETTLTTLGNTVKFQAERSMKIIPVTMHYNTDNNQFYLQEVISPLGGGRYPFEEYLTSRSLDTDAVTNGNNLVFSIRDFYIDASTVDHQFPPSNMTTATAKTVKIKKSTLYGGGYVQYNGQDVYFELDTQNIQTIYDPMDFFSPLLMYAPKTNTDDRPHRIVWVPRDQYVYGTAERIGVVEQRETALENDMSFLKAPVRFYEAYMVLGDPDNTGTDVPIINVHFNNLRSTLPKLPQDNTRYGFIVSSFSTALTDYIVALHPTSVVTFYLRDAFGWIRDENDNIMTYSVSFNFGTNYNHVGVPMVGNFYTNGFILYLGYIHCFGTRLKDSNDKMYGSLAIGNGLSISGSEVAGYTLDVTGSVTGGNFIDIGNPIVQSTDYDSHADVTYIAQSNCVMIARMLASNGSAAWVKLNNVEVFRLYFSSGTNESSYTLYLKTGQTVTLHTPEANYKSSYAVYPITN